MKAIPHLALIFSLFSSLAAEVTVKVVGLRVVAKEYQEEGAEETLRAFRNFT